MLKSLGVDACAEYKKGKVAYHLSRVRKGDVMCPLCNRKCSSSQKLKNHIRAKHQEVISYQCATCGKSFGDSFTLKTHIQIHKKPSSTKRLKCRICGKRCYTASHLVQHEKDHIGEGGTCQYCGLHLAQLRSLPAHESSCKKNPANIEMPRVKQHVCPDCSKAYFNRKDLNHHCKIHHALRYIHLHCTGYLWPCAGLNCTALDSAHISNFLSCIVIDLWCCLIKLWSLCLNAYVFLFYPVPCSVV